MKRQKLYRTQRSVGYVLVLVLASYQAYSVRGQEVTSATGNALQALFNPGSASSVNTMGMLQRSNFVDRIAGKRGRLEIALVVDATDSMEEQLLGIQSKLGHMLADIRRMVGDEVYVQILLYRDVGAPSGTLEWPLGNQTFTRDLSLIEAGLARLKPETGAPYFHEVVDQGLHAAMTQLSWSKDPQTTRWLLLIGDAPPFDVGFNEPKTGAQRKYSTEQLIQLAQLAGIEIHTILCPTRAQDADVYAQTVSLTRSFFSELSSQTGGLMLDLSDPELLANVTDAAQKAVEKFTPIEPISAAELRELRSRAEREQSSLSPSKRIRVAVLPHLTFPEMTFDKRNPAVRFGDEMRSQLETAGQDVELVSSREVSLTYFRLPLQGMGQTAILQQIGMALATDYVIWGTLLDGEPDRIQSGIFDSKSGQLVADTKIQTRFPANANQCSTVLDGLAAESRRLNRPLQLARVQRKFKTRLVANTEDVERLQQSARAFILDAMELQVGAANSWDLFVSAEKELLEANRLESDNPVTSSLLANVYFNQFQILAAQGDTTAVVKRRSALEFARTAMRGLSRVLDVDRLEIQADVAFYSANFEQAAQLYEQLAATGQTLNHVRRARWMLAGIYAGDWGIAKSAPNLIDARKARGQVVQLLAFFEDGPEARFFKNLLVWDENRGTTLNANLPLMHTDLPFD